jgi:peptide/nickel transport system substrate-binding protein
LAYVPIVPADAPEVITQPIGTGPYRLVAFEPGEMVELVAFEAHWSGPPPEPRVELVFLSDPAERIGGLLAGELDLVNELSARDVATVEQHEGLRVESRTSLGVEYLQMDVSAPPFDDPRVRHAIDLALDRRALVDEIALGQGRPVGQMVPPDVFGYDPALGPVERDLAEAHRLIVEAGYPQGLDLVLEVREGRPVLPLVRQLAEAGLRVEVVARPWSEMYPRLVSGEVPFYYGGWVATSADASDLLDHKVHTPDPERGYGASNSNRYSNPEIDRLIEALDEAATMGERRELLQEVLGRLGRDAAFVPLYTPFELYGLRADLRWRPRQDARVYAHEMER